MSWVFWSYLLILFRQRDLEYRWCPVLEGARCIQSLLWSGRSWVCHHTIGANHHEVRDWQNHPRYPVQGEGQPQHRHCYRHQPGFWGLGHSMHALRDSGYSNAIPCARGHANAGGGWAKKESCNPGVWGNQDGGNQHCWGKKAVQNPSIRYILRPRDSAWAND